MLLSKDSQVGRYRKSRGRSAYTISEHSLQCLCEDYLDALQVEYVRFPDALYRIIFGNGSSVPIQVKTMLAAFMRGKPDLIILKPDGQCAKALCIELKVGSNKMSQGQLNFAKKIPVTECRDFDSFKILVDKFLT